MNLDSVCHPDRIVVPKVKSFGFLEIAPEIVSTLPNGIRLHLIKAGDQPGTRLTIIWHYGLPYMPRCYAPVVLPALMLEGAADMTGAEIAERIDYEGAWLTPRASDNYPGFDLIALDSAMPALLPLLSDIMLRPTLPTEAFNTLIQKAVAKTRLSHSRTTVRATSRLLSLIAGSGHPYCLDFTPDDIEATTIDQVRHAWREGVLSSPIDIYLAGNPSDKVVEAVRHFAIDLRSKPVDARPPKFTAYRSEGVSYEKFTVPGARQASVAIGIPAIGRSNPDYNSLRMTVVALGGYFGSRLMTSIREEQGLTYGIQAGLLGDHNNAYISISADCDPSYTDDVLKGIDAEIRRLATEPMGDDELQRLRMFLGTVLASTLDSPFAVADYYIRRLTVGTPDDYFEAQQRDLASLNADTIMLMTRRYLLDNPETSIVVATPA